MSENIKTNVKIAKAIALFDELTINNISMHNNKKIHSFIESTIKYNPDINIDFVKKLSKNKIRYIDKSKDIYLSIEKRGIWGSNYSAFNYTLKPSKVNNSVQIYHESDRIGNAHDYYLDLIDEYLYKKQKLSSKKVAPLKKARLKAIDKKIADLNTSLELVGDDMLTLDETKKALSYFNKASLKHSEIKKSSNQDETSSKELLFHELNHTLCDTIYITKVKDKYGKPHYIKLTPQNAKKYHGKEVDVYVGGLYLEKRKLKTNKDIRSIGDSKFFSNGAHLVNEALTECIAQNMTNFESDKCGYSELYPYIALLDIFTNHNLTKSYYNGKPLNDNLYLTSIIRCIDTCSTVSFITRQKDLIKGLNCITLIMLANYKLNDNNYDKKLKEATNDKWIEDFLSKKFKRKYKQLSSLSAQELKEIVAMGNEGLNYAYNNTNRYFKYEEERLAFTHPITLDKIVEEEKDVLPLLNNFEDCKSL